MTETHPRRPGEQSEESPTNPLTESDRGTLKETTPHDVATLEEPSELAAIYEQGLKIEARSQWQLARSRFFRHKLAMVSLGVLVIIFGAAVFAETVAPYAYEAQNFEDTSQGPSGEHLFGTDQLGRDYFSRVVFGIRTSARVAFLVALLSTALGTTVGAISGYFGGWVDNLLMRLTDLVLTLPPLAVLLAASALLGQGSPYRVAIILALVYWTTLARLVRGVFLSLREKEYVEAAKAIGASDPRIIVRHILPNTVGPIVVNATLVIGLAILVEAVLAFLGFGVQPPTPALGSLISKGAGLVEQWWLVTFPGLTIVMVVLCINFLGDGLRDALDPTQRRVGA
ncbi:MAG: ABC transporter permease [Actinomycetota bacterium]